MQTYLKCGSEEIALNCGMCAGCSGGGNWQVCVDN